MSSQKYFKAFQELGIEPEPLLEYYTPDLFAKKLMERFDKRKSSRVFFSPHIEYNEQISVH